MICTSDVLWFLFVKIEIWKKNPCDKDKDKIMGYLVKVRRNIPINANWNGKQHKIKDAKEKYKKRTKT